MPRKWKQRPDGSNWGDFGPDDQLGRVNLLTPENTLKAAQEVRVGRRFCLSLPLDIPTDNALNTKRHPPEFKAVIRDGHIAFNLPLAKINPRLTEVNCDEAVLLYMQHSTQWDGFAHMGSMFDADGDGNPEPVFYNGHGVLDGEKGTPRFGTVGTHNLGMEHLAKACLQGRGVMIDLAVHFGREHKPVGYDDLMRIMEADGIEVEEGDLVCMHTGYIDAVLEHGGTIPREMVRTICPAFDGWDDRLLQWITDSGLVALIADNRAVEFEHGGPKPEVPRGPLYTIHELCLFKLGIHLGELWYLTELAQWLRENGRYRFLLTAPPLHLPGAVGSPANPIATV
ncbi:cyclase family protein [Candidatus Uhrbacteria bacterium]|nr:cyclase family protein [Candidatus Uhrbacteria bacterium]